MNAVKFKALRLRESMTQKEFANLLGVSESTVAAIETGRRNVSDTVRARLVQSVDVGSEFISFFEKYNEISHNTPIIQ